MDATVSLRGSIVDSWLERAPSRRGEARVILQVASRDCRLMVVEAPPSLLPDEGWLEDLRGNFCHGSPVRVEGRLTPDGSLAASRLHLER